MPPPDLVIIPFSPWSERARWALDHLGVGYRKVVYTPTVSEPALRLRLRLTGRLTIPVLIDGDQVLGDSGDIVRWAARGRPAFVPEAVSRLEPVVERALTAGRVAAGSRVLEDRAALRASVPPPLRKLGRVAELAAADTWKRILRKYALGTVEPGSLRSTMAEALETLQAEVGEGSPVGSELSYADILIASALAFVEPREDIPLDPVVVAAWRDPELAERFAPLVAWRDALRAAHRHPAEGGLRARPLEDPT